MDIYIFTILFFAACSLFELNFFNYDIDKIKKTLIFISILLLTLQLGMRWEMATDWEPYLELFDENNYIDIVKNTQYEIGFNLLTVAGKFILGDYTLFLILQASLFFVVCIYFYRIYTKNLFIALLWFYTSTIGVWGANRQFIAVIFVLLSIVFLLKNKKFGYFAMMICAFFFHSSSIIALVYYFLRRRFTLLIIVSFLLVALIIGKSNLPLQIFGFFGSVTEITKSKADLYIAHSEVDFTSGYTIIGLLKRSLFLLLFLVTRDKLSRIIPQYQFFLNGYIFSLGLYFMFAESLPVLISRGSFYFNILEPLLLSSQILLLNKKDKILNTIVVITIGVISYFLFLQSIALYPQAYLPYKSFFNK